MKKHKKSVIIGIIVLLFAIIVGFVFFRPSQEHAGKIIGPNPNNIPKNKLPICDFDGSRFITQPCYSPPGSAYF
jgi:hypothetical protein